MDLLPFTLFIILLLKDLAYFMKKQVFDHVFTTNAFVGILLSLSGSIITLYTFLIKWLEL